MRGDRGADHAGDLSECPGKAARIGHCNSIGVACVSKLDIDSRIAEREGFGPTLLIDNTELIDFTIP